MSRNVWAASAVAMMIVVTACGGGGSGVTGPSTPTFKEGDVIECYRMEEVKRTLESAAKAPSPQASA